MPYVPFGELIGDQTIAADGRNLVGRANGEPVFVRGVCGRYYDYETATGPAIQCQGFAGTYESVAIGLDAPAGLLSGGTIVGFVISTRCQGVPPLTDAELFAAGCSTTPPPEPQPETPNQSPLPPSPPGPKMTECCDTLAEILQQIADILGELKEGPRQDCNSSCDATDSCVAEIADKLCKQHGICNKSCGECCDELKLGVTLSAEDAAACSRCACDEAAIECSMSQGETEGKRCTTCGKDPCCCENNVCVPCEDEPDKPKKYIGWCHKITGVIVVLKEGSPSPGPQYSQASIAETEAIAFAEAERYCKKPDEPPKPPTPPPSHPSLHGGPLCDYDDLARDGAFSSFISSTGESVGLAYFTDIIRTTSDAIYSQLGVIPVIGPVAAAIQNATAGPIASAKILADDIPGLLGCVGDSFAGGLRAITAIGLYSKWTGADLTGFADTLSYSMNAICRRKHLDPDKAIAAWLTGSIDDKLLDTHWAIAGFCSDALEAYKLAAKSKPVPLQLAQMHFRELISLSEYHAGMRRLGYIDEKVSDQLLTLAHPLPTLSDIVSFMVRDADDESEGGPVKKFNLDSGFSDKYGGQLKQWSASQGIDPKIAQYAWRSHWSIPAPTQLFEFYHRLRKNPEFGDVLGDVKTALIQQDILPYWHKHFLAVSFRPIGRVDIRRAYNIGAMNDAEVLVGMQNLGYSDENADTMMGFFRRLRDEAASGNKAIKLWQKFAISGQECRERMITGGLPADVVAKAMLDSEIGFKQSYAAAAYKNGEIPRASFVAGLTAHGVSVLGAERLADQLAYAMKVVPSIIDYEAGTVDRIGAITQAVDHGMAFHRAETFVRYIDAKIDKQGAIACQHGVKQRFLLGEFDGTEAKKQLAANGITQARIDKLIGWWECEKKATGKAIAANTLCEWRARGAIGAMELRDRLIAVGYSPQDSMNLITDCEIKVNTRRAKEDKQRIEDAAKLEAKDKAARDRAAAKIARLAAQQAKANAQAKATLARRQLQLMKAADKVIRKCDCDVGEAVSFVSAAKQRLQAEFGLSIDEALRSLLLATDQWDGESFDSLASSLNYHAQIIVDEAIAEAKTGPLPSSSTNGDTRPS